MGESIYKRVQTLQNSQRHCILSLPPVRLGTAARLVDKTASGADRFFRTARADDEMRHFLIGAAEYLSSFAEGEHRGAGQHHPGDERRRTYGAD